LELSLEFAEVIDDDMSDLYVQLIMGSPIMYQGRVRAGREPEVWERK
jgi:hypothetical protein